MAESETYDDAFVLDELNKFVDSFALKQEAANALGVSRVFLWKVLNGTTPPTETILKQIGLKKVRTISYHYEKLDNAA